MNHFSKPFCEHHGAMWICEQAIQTETQYQRTAELSWQQQVITNMTVLDELKFMDFVQVIMVMTESHLVSLTLFQRSGCDKHILSLACYCISEDTQS